MMRPAAEPAPAIRLGLDGDPGTGLVGGDAVVPARPDERFRNAPPRYPVEAQLRHEHGIVTVLIHVGPDGQPVGVDVIESSGWRILDDAVLAAVRRWRFQPAIQGGQPVMSQLRFRVEFEPDRG
jgi:protein TonB